MHKQYLDQVLMDYIYFMMDLTVKFKIKELVIYILQVVPVLILITKLVNRWLISILMGPLSYSMIME